MTDRVFSRDGAWFCMVAGREFGAWRSRAEAIAGMQVEQRRAAARANKGA